MCQSLLIPLQVDRIITEMGVFDVTNGQLILREIAEDVTMDQLKAATAADFKVADDLCTMRSA